MPSEGIQGGLRAAPHDLYRSSSRMSETIRTKICPACKGIGLESVTVKGCCKQKVGIPCKTCKGSGRVPK